MGARELEVDYKVSEHKDVPLYELWKEGVLGASFLMEVWFDEDYETSDKAMVKLNEYSNTFDKLKEIRELFEDEAEDSFALNDEDGNEVIALNKDMLNFFINYIDIKKVEAYNMVLNLTEYERNRNGFY